MQPIQNRSDDPDRGSSHNPTTFFAGARRGEVGNKGEELPEPDGCTRIHPAGELEYDYYLWLAQSYDNPHQSHDINLNHNNPNIEQEK
jgi:hypothetical protein